MNDDSLSVEDPIETCSDCGKSMLAAYLTDEKCEACRE